MSSGSCPCGRTGTFGTLDYQRCCGRYLDAGEGGPAAPDAESLMRSRYCAFALGRAGYLLATWDPAHRPDRLDLDPGRAWLGLQVLEHRADGDRAEVEFIARYADPGGREQALHERSSFTRGDDGRWRYGPGRPL